MKRIEFSLAIIKLLNQMVEEGERPLIDYVKRSSEEQNRLYRCGLSKCDGYKKESMHQYGKAMDIYFVNAAGKAFTDEGEAVPPNKGWDYWHSQWIKLAGEPMISWDKAHFEMS